MDINAGIHDGHGGKLGGAGSVPVGHSIRAYNELVKASGGAKHIIPECLTTGLHLHVYGIDAETVSSFPRSGNKFGMTVWKILDSP